MIEKPELRPRKILQVTPTPVDPETPVSLDTLRAQNLAEELGVKKLGDGLSQAERLERQADAIAAGQIDVLREREMEKVHGITPDQAEDEATRFLREHGFNEDGSEVNKEAEL